MKGLSTKSGNNLPQNFAKRFLSVMLALAMILTCLPEFTLTRAYAEATAASETFANVTLGPTTATSDVIDLNGTSVMQLSLNLASYGKVENADIGASGTASGKEEGNYIISDTIRWSVADEDGNAVSDVLKTAASEGNSIGLGVTEAYFVASTLEAGKYTVTVSISGVAVDGSGNWGSVTVNDTTVSYSIYVMSAAISGVDSVVSGDTEGIELTVERNGGTSADTITKDEYETVNAESTDLTTLTHASDIKGNGAYFVTSTAAWTLQDAAGKEVESPGNYITEEDTEKAKFVPGELTPGRYTVTYKVGPLVAYDAASYKATAAYNNYPTITATRSITVLSNEAIVLGGTSDVVDKNGARLKLDVDLSGAAYTKDVGGTDETVSGLTPGATYILTKSAVWSVWPEDRSGDEITGAIMADETGNDEYKKGADTAYFDASGLAAGSYTVYVSYKTAVAKDTTSWKEDESGEQSTSFEINVVDAALTVDKGYVVQGDATGIEVAVARNGKAGDIAAADMNKAAYDAIVADAEIEKANKEGVWFALSTESWTMYDSKGVAVDSPDEYLTETAGTKVVFTPGNLPGGVYTIKYNSSLLSVYEDAEGDLRASYAAENYPVVECETEVVVLEMKSTMAGRSLTWDGTNKWYAGQSLFLNSTSTTAGKEILTVVGDSQIMDVTWSYNDDYADNYITLTQEGGVATVVAEKATDSAIAKSKATIKATYTDSDENTYELVYKTVVTDKGVAVDLYNTATDTDGNTIIGSKVLTDQTVTISKGTSTAIWVDAVQEDDTIKDPESFSIKADKSGIVTSDKDGSDMYFTVTGDAVGTAVLTVTVTGENDAENTANVTIKVVDDGISAAPEYVYLSVYGDEKTVTATTKQSSSTVNWSIETGEDAQIDSVDPDSKDPKIATIISENTPGSGKVRATLGNSSTQYADVNVTVFGLTGHKSTESGSTYTLLNQYESAAAFKTDLMYVYSSKQKKAFVETQTLRFSDGTTNYLGNPGGGTLTWTNTNPKIVELDEETGVLTPTGEEFGTAVITGTYTYSDQGAGATVALTLYATVKDYSFTFNSYGDLKLSAGSTEYTIDPVVTVTNVSDGESKVVKKSEAEAASDPTEAQAIVQALTFTYNVEAPSDVTGAAIDANGKVTAGASPTTSGKPYTITMGAKFTSSALVTTTVEETTFDLYVLEKVTAITSPETGSAFYIPVTDRRFTRKLQAGLEGNKDIEVELSYVAFSTEAGNAVIEPEAEISFDGTNLVIVPSEPESFYLRVGDAGLATDTIYDSPANNLATYAVNIVGFTTGADSTAVTTLSEGVYSTSIWMTSENMTGNSVSKILFVDPENSTGLVGQNVTGSDLDEAVWYVDWSSDNEKIVVQGNPQGDGNTFEAKITASPKGGTETGTVKATIYTYKSGVDPSALTDLTTGAINIAEISTTVTVKDYSSVEVNKISDIQLGVGDQKSVEASLSSAAVTEDITYEYSLALTNKSGVTADSGDITVNGENVTSAVNPAIIKVNNSTKCAGATVTVTAYVGATKNTEYELGSKSFKVVIVELPNAISWSDNTAVELNTITVVTNLATDGKGNAKNSGITLADLTSELYSLGKGWSWENPKQKVADLGQAGQTAAANLVYTSDDYTTSKEITIKLLEIRGLEAEKDYNAAISDESASSISVDTALKNVTINRIGFVSTNGLDGNKADGNDLNTFLGKYQAIVGVTDAKLFNTSISGKSVTDVGEFANAAGNRAFTLTVSPTVTGKSTVTITSLGFTAKVTVNNVAKLAEFGALSFPSTVSEGEGDYAGNYFVMYDALSDSEKTIAFDITVKSATKLTVKSSDSSVAKVTTASVTPTGTTFSPSFTVVGPGYTEITLTADDSVKSPYTIKFWSTQSKPSIASMELDRAITYANATTEVNVVNVGFSGVGYEYSSIELESQASSTGETGEWFTLNDGTTTAPYLTFTSAAASKRPADGTYTLKFKVVTKNLLKNNSTTSKTFTGETAIVATVEVGTKTFAKGEFTVKQNETTNLFYTENTIKLIFTGKNCSVGTVSLNDSNYTIDGGAVDPSTGAVSIQPGVTGLVEVQLKAGVDTTEEIKAAMKGSAKKLTFNVTPLGYSTVIPVQFSVKVNYKAPTVKLSNKSATVYRLLETGMTFGTELSDTNGDILNTGNDFTIKLVDNKTAATNYADGTTSAPFVLTEGDVTGTATAYSISAKKTTAAGSWKAAISVQDKTGNTWRAKNHIAKAPLTIKIDDKSKKLKLAADQKTVTLYSNSDYIGKEIAYVSIGVNGGTSLTDEQSKKLAVTGANAKSTAALGSMKIERGQFDAAGEFTASNKDIKGSVYAISLKSSLGKGTYKISISNSAVSSTPVAVTIKVVDSTKLTIKAKGSIDILDPTSAITITPALTGISGKIVNAEITGANASMFDVKTNASAVIAGVGNTADKITTTNGLGSKGEVYLVRGDYHAGAATLSYTTKQKFTVNVKYTIHLGDVNGEDKDITAVKPISFKVKNGKMWATASPSNPIVAMGNTKTVKFSAYHKGTKGTANSLIVATDGTTIATRTAYIVQANNQKKVKFAQGTLENTTNVLGNTNTGSIQITPLNLKPGKTVSVKFNVYEFGQATNVKPTTVTVKITAPK